jgi:hypothetical protein
VNVVVWVATGILAAMMLMAGAMKLAKSQPELIESGQGWAGEFTPGTIKMIGTLEVLGAIGLILPSAFDSASWLVGPAAIGIAILMVGAAITHARRQEYSNVAVNVVLLVIAVFVAVERLGPLSF